MLDPRFPESYSYSVDVDKGTLTLANGLVLSVEQTGKQAGIGFEVELTQASPETTHIAFAQAPLDALAEFLQAAGWSVEAPVPTVSLRRYLHQTRGTIDSTEAARLTGSTFRRVQKKLKQLVDQSFTNKFGEILTRTRHETGSTYQFQAGPGSSPEVSG